MGYLARQLLQQEKTTLIKVLTQAYADEWFAHYNYWFVAKTVCGPASSAVATLLLKKAQRALVRANRLATASKWRALGSISPQREADKGL